jgi:hypothetical protein
MVAFMHCHKLIDGELIKIESVKINVPRASVQEKIYSGVCWAEVKYEDKPKILNPK